jgi:hypothetical protein
MLLFSHVLIHNYGLFWRRSDVFWGKQKVKGHLLGIRADNLKAAPIDFHDQQGVYVLYDDSFKSIYVGQAGKAGQKLFTRLEQHNRDALADRWTRFSWFGTRWVKQNGELARVTASSHPTTSKVLDHIEAILISSVEPPNNRQGGRFGDEVDQYLQHRDVATLGLTEAEMLRKILELQTKSN